MTTFKNGAYGRRAVATTLLLLAGVAHAASVMFASPPAFTLNADGTMVSISADVLSDCDPTTNACAPGFVAGDVRVQLWASVEPFVPPSGTNPPAPTHGAQSLALTTLQHYDPATGRSVAVSSPGLFTAPAVAGLYYITAVLIGSRATLSSVVLYDSFSFPKPTYLAAGPAMQGVAVHEYYNADMDHYFLTALANEVALCEAGIAPCAGWAPTGYVFAAYASETPPLSSMAVCRFLNEAYAPKSSHFYALQGATCDQTIALFPDWHLESTNVFALDVPTMDGSCDVSDTPVYRLFNNGKGGAPNHRFTIDPAIRMQMLAQGWIAEGVGTLGVAFCSPRNLLD